MLIIIIFGMVFVAISEIQSNAAHPNPFNYGTCPLSQFATGITTNTLDCGSASNSNYLTTQTSAFFDYGTCPNNQYATAVTTTTLNCASASNSNYLTTQTLVLKMAILLYKDTNRYIKTITNTLQKVGASYTVPANSYTYILIESSGYIGYGGLSTLQIDQLYNYAGGSQVDNGFFSQAATVVASSYVFWTTSTMEGFTAGGNATVLETAAATDANTNIYQTSFYVYGIV